MSDQPVVHVIDDDDAVRDSLRFLIECAGHTVRDYSSAKAFLEALGPAGTPAPGCIVTDVRMPEMTGVELMQRLKELAISEPMIVVTGHADVPMAIQAMKAGATDFIEKPFDDETILSAVEGALAARNQSIAADQEQREAQARIATLSDREREVLDGLVEGKANKIIAFDLGISVRTVEVYRAHVMTKMQVKSLSELVRLAVTARPS
jgi:two-component system response regulator FixJ